MSHHTAITEWARNGQPFIDRRYSREHLWRFDGGAEVPASSSPHVVRAPFSNPAHVDPEEAFVAALSSCHLLWFLDLASRGGWCVERYTDEAVGHMVDGADGQPWVALVLLRPQVAFAGERVPDAATVQALHHAAHAACFLARSVRSEVRVEPR